MSRTTRSPRFLLQRNAQISAQSVNELQDGARLVSMTHSITILPTEFLTAIGSLFLHSFSNPSPAGAHWCPRVFRSSLSV